MREEAAMKQRSELVPFFAEHHGCAICIGVCPWTTAGRAATISDIMLRRRTTKPTHTAP